MAQFQESSKCAGVIIRSMYTTVVLQGHDGVLSVVPGCAGGEWWCCVYQVVMVVVVHNGDKLVMPA